MQIYSKDGKRLDQAEDYDLVNTFETMFDREPKEPKDYGDRLAIGFEMMEK